MNTLKNFWKLQVILIIIINILVLAKNANVTDSDKDDNNDYYTDYNDNTTESNFFKYEKNFTFSDCFEPIEGENHCLALNLGYTWDYKKQNCTEGVWGGCWGTNNFFFRLEDCEKIAMPICKGFTEKIEKSNNNTK